MKPLIALIPLVLAAVPPARFQGEASAYVHFVHDVAATCPIKAPAGYTLKGCHQKLGKQSILILPNPCAYPGEFARIACHEIGHVNGWGHE